MNDRTPLSYEEVCRYAGQLFLETRHQLELLTARALAAERERDQAVQAFQSDRKE
jgi:hypothetical protein